MRSDAQLVVALSQALTHVVQTWTLRIVVSGQELQGGSPIAAQARTAGPQALILSLNAPSNETHNFVVIAVRRTRVLVVTLRNRVHFLVVASRHTHAHVVPFPTVNTLCLCGRVQSENLGPAVSDCAGDVAVTVAGEPCAALTMLQPHSTLLCTTVVHEGTISVATALGTVATEYSATELLLPPIVNSVTPSVWSTANDTTIVILGERCVPACAPLVPASAPGSL